MAGHNKGGQGLKRSVVTQKKKKKKAFFCLRHLHDKTISNLVSFATAYVSEQSTLVRCSSTRRTIMLNV
jgi:hypothetical protein